jgi:UPF0755 protein
MPEEHIPEHTHRSIYIIIVACAAVIITAFILTYATPPADFRSGTIVHIEKDTTLSQIDNELYDEHVIRSPFLFRIIVTVLGERKSVGAGDYFFENPENVWQVAYRLAHDEQDLSQVRVILPEGITVREMGVIIGTDLSGSLTRGMAPAFTFDEKGFLASASTSEGYLFPDTYFFLPNVTPAAVITVLKNNFNEKIATLTPAIIAFQASIKTSNIAKSYPRTLANIVTMASILEREAISTIDRRIIAGILWKRLDASEPLQVDAPFMYIMGKTSAELTLTDLATTSPYNTYNHTGLPPTPIGNPGLDALTAAVTPTATKYWYYVSDKAGVIHYAETYSEQEVNEAKYVE